VGQNTGGVVSMGYSQDEVLRYQKGRRSQQTVKRHYMQWRKEQTPPIKMRCDNECCQFFHEPLIWYGKHLMLCGNYSYEIGTYLNRLSMVFIRS